MLVDHFRNLPPSLESVVFLSTLLLDTYSFPEVRLPIEKLSQCRRHHRIKHIVVGEICSLPQSIAMLQALQLTLPSRLLWSIARWVEDLLFLNILQSWSWLSSSEVLLSLGIVQDAFPRFEISGYPWYHCENKFHNSSSLLEARYWRILRLSSHFSFRYHGIPCSIVSQSGRIWCQTPWIFEEIWGLSFSSK